MEKRLRFSIDKAEIVEDPNDSHFATARIQAFNTGVSMHQTDCDVETLQKQAYTLYEKPIIFEYSSNMNDFGTHNEKTTVPAGFVVPNTAEFVQTNDGTGRTALVVLAKIWKKYSGKFLQVFQDENQTKKSVSVEMEVRGFEEKPNGILQLLDFTFAAVCVLGEFVTPASPGANIELLSFAKEYAEDYKKEFSDKYSELDLSIPSSVKKNATKALESKKGSSVALALARYLIANEKINPERVKQISKFFKNKDVKQIDEITLGLYGGKQGYSWAKELSEKITEIDGKQLSYYSNDEIVDGEKSVIDNYLGMEMEVEKIDMAEEIKKEDEKEVEMAKPEEKEETPPEEKAEEEKKFSYAEIFGSDELFAQMFADEEDDEEEEKEKFAQAKQEYGVGANPATMMHAMYAKMCKMSKKMEKMSEDSKVYMAENEELKKFKADVESKQKEFAVNSTLKELSETVVIPEDKLSEMRTESEKYSLGEIDGWKNYAKALCFDFKPKKQKEKDEEDITVYALPFINTKVQDSDDVWARIS